jgi:hypothetical protein
MVKTFSTHGVYFSVTRPGVGNTRSPIYTLLGTYMQLLWSYANRSWTILFVTSFFSLFLSFSFFLSRLLSVPCMGWCGLWQYGNPVASIFSNFSQGWSLSRWQQYFEIGIHQKVWLLTDSKLWRVLIFGQMDWAFSSASSTMCYST